MKKGFVFAFGLTCAVIVSACGGSSPGSNSAGQSPVAETPSTPDDQPEMPPETDTQPRLAVAAPASFSEGNEGSQVVTFAVQLSPAADESVSVDYVSQSSSATDGRDYTAVSGTVQFAAGETSKTIDVSVLADECNEPLETLEIALSNPVGAVVSQATAAVAIIDDDPIGAPLRAGAAKRVASPTQQDIDGQDHEYCDDLKQQFYLGGFGLRRVDATDCESPLSLAGKAPIEGVMADSHVRLLLIEQTDGVLVAFVTLDAVGTGNIIQKGVKRAISQAIGIAENNIQFGATHAHSGADLQGLWGGVPFEWRQRLYTAAAAAATEALAGMQDAEVYYSTGIIDDPSFNSYRRVDDTIGTDMQMAVLQARALNADDSGNNAVIGTLVQYVAHPTKMGSDYRFIHGDYITGLNDAMEQQYPGSTSLYFNGPIADASGSNQADVPEGASREVAAVLMGEALAERAIEIISDEPQRFMPELAYDTATASVPVTNSLFQVVGAKGYFNGYYDFVSGNPDPDARATADPQVVANASTVVSRLTLGRIGCEALEVVTIPGEASNPFGQYIRSLAPDTDMMLLGLTHNSFGYIITEDKYGSENGTTLATDPDPVYPAGYEEGVSLGAGTAPALREQAYNPLFDAPVGTGATAPGS